MRRFVAWLATPSGLAFLFIAGFLLRLVLARRGGFPYDMTSFAAWSGRLASGGPWHFYPRGAEKFFVDYPPGYLYVLWVLGLAAKLAHNGFPPVFWIKFPSILTDLGLAWVVSLAAHRLTPPSIGRRVPVRVLAAAAILFNPAIFFVSAIWGQADAVLALLVIGSFLLLATGPPTFRREAAGVAVLAIAIATKPQSVFVVPIVVLLLAWRHVRDRDSRAAGIQRMAGFAGIGALTGYALYIPFHLTPAGALSRYLLSTRTYPVTSVFAFNLWGTVGFWKPDSKGADAIRFLGVPALYWGMALFVAAGALVLGRAWAALREGQDEGRVLFVGGAAMSLVSFAVVTRVHERYLFLPLALCATLIGIKWFRRAFVVLSVLYMVNIYFPYVYYLGVEHRPAMKFGGLFDVLYGTDIYGFQMRVLSLVIALACLAIAARGWRALDAASGVPSPDDGGVLVTEGLEIVEVDAAPRPWSFRLHTVGRKGAWLALAVFAIAFLSKVIGLGHPPGMYFDEVYHARAGAEYYGHKEVFEYTHPPFAKEVMGFAIQHLSNFNAHDGASVPAGLVPSSVVPRDTDEVWVTQNAANASVISGQVDGSCGLKPTRTIATINGVTADAAAANENAVYIAIHDGDQSSLARYADGAQNWRATLPSNARAVALAGDAAVVVTTHGELVVVSAGGIPDTVAVGADEISSLGPDGPVWASFPGQGRIASWSSDGKRAAVIETGGEPHQIVAHRDAQRVYVDVGNTIISYDTDQNGEQSRVEGAAKLLGTVPETPVIWASNGTALRAIEPLSGVAIGHIAFARTPETLTADRVHHRLIGIADGKLECAGGRPQFAWRLGSAVMGAFMVAMVFLLALRLFGSYPAAGLAALFLGIDGLAFTVSRIAMNDSYATGFLLAAWFCALSALRLWGRGDAEESWLNPPKDRVATSLWLIATGVFGGLSLASKWVGLYAVLGIIVVMLWDGFNRGEHSIWHAAGGFVSTSLLLFGTLIALPLAIYVISYQPYLSLGHSFVDMLKLQQSMYNYHATLTATHPFGSRWFFWPFGRRAVFLYLGGTGTPHSEIWTIPNIVVFWGGIVAMAFVARRAWKTRSVPLTFLVFGAATQYLPWTIVGRVTFIYHYLPTVPFLALALAWTLIEGIKEEPWGKTVAVAVTAAAVALFVALYPLLVGWDVSVRYMDLVKNALPWIFR